MPGSPRSWRGWSTPKVLPEEPAQRKLVGVFQRHLRATSAETREVGTEGGCPVFKVVPSAGVRGRELRNLILGSAKPDLRLIELIDDDAPQTMNRDEVILYDRPIGDNGLRWCDLQDWRQETKGPNDSDEAKDALYKRIRPAGTRRVCRDRLGRSPGVGRDPLHR
ncbi:hypothetical protein ACWD33_19340 [Streptomyces xiamenensis]